MSSSKWLAAAALVAVAIPAAQAAERTRVQVTIAPYGGWDRPVRYVGDPCRRGGFDRYYGYGDRYDAGRYHADSWGFWFGGPLLQFDYRSSDRDRYYRPDGYRPGGGYRYDSRRDRHYGRDRDRDRRDWDRRDWRDGDRRGRDGGWRDHGGDSRYRGGDDGGRRWGR